MEEVGKRVKSDNRGTEPRGYIHYTRIHLTYSINKNVNTRAHLTLARAILIYSTVLAQRVSGELTKKALLKQQFAQYNHTTTHELFAVDSVNYHYLYFKLGLYSLNHYYQYFIYLRCSLPHLSPCKVAL